MLQEKQNALNKKDFWKLLICMCAIMLGTQIPMCLSPLGAYIVRDYPNIDPTTAISIVSTPRMMCGMITIVALAPIMLKANRKRVGQVFLLIYIAFAAMFYFFGHARTSFWALYGAAFFVGIPAGGYTILTTTLAAENTDNAADRAKLIGRYQAVGAALYVCYLTISGRLAAGNDGYDWPNAWLIGFGAVIGLIIWTVLFPKGAEQPKKDPSVAKQEKVKFTWKAFTPGVILMAITYLNFYLCQNVYNTSVSQWVITERAVGTSADAADATSIGRIVLMFVGFALPLAVKYLGKWQIPIGGMFTLLANCLLFFGKDLPVLYVASACLNIGTGLTNYGVNTYCYEVAKPGYGVIAASTMTMMMMCAGTVAPYVLSFLSPLFGGGFNGKLMSGIFMGVILVISTILFHTTNNRFRYPNYDKETEQA